MNADKFKKLLAERGRKLEAVNVPYGSPDWDLIERFGRAATKKAFNRSPLSNHCPILETDLAAVRAWAATGDGS